MVGVEFGGLLDRHVLLALFLGLAVPASSAAAAEAFKSVEIADVPHVRQKPDFCGEACAAMALRKLGRQCDQDFVFDQSGLDPALGRGCYTKELAAALSKIGFETGPVWHRVAVQRAERELARLWKELHADVMRGNPSIVCMRYDERPKTTEHFRLVLGYRAEKDEVVFHEPAASDGAYQTMPRKTFLSLWPLKYGEDEWTVVWLRLMPGKLVNGQVAKTVTAADYAQHLIAMQDKIPEGFTVVVQPPFVVLGDESEATVRRRADDTVKWAVDLLKQAYFKHDPTEIIDVWLFENEESYESNAKKLFKVKLSTPYGYYSPTDKALVMNIGTGGGTLVHEIVHPFVAANFPRCPAWLNEGLGSLYEQCDERRGKIIGRTNWRLAGLQKAIRRERVPDFKTLLGTTPKEFYDDDQGTNYAQARYLCYYLQEHDLLNDFYHRFRANCRHDPSGYTTLCEVLERDDLEDFKTEWEEYVLELHYPE